MALEKETGPGNQTGTPEEIQGEVLKETPPKSGRGAIEGCTVDWGWLEGRTVRRVTSDLKNLVVEFEDGLVFKVQALNYKGEPFLSFNPYRPPAK